MTSNRGRRWCFTKNGYTPEYLSFLKEKEATSPLVYLVCGEELAPTTGQPHLQGYICFDRPMRLPAVKNYLDSLDVHLEQARGTSEENKVYCLKGGQGFEVGTAPKEPAASGGEAIKRKYEKAYESAITGNLGDIDKDLLIRHYGNFKKLAVDFGTPPPPLQGTCGLWLYGAPGVGKSHKARSMCNDDYYPKPANKWWDGYRGQANVIIDDIDPRHADLAYDLKCWADKYAFISEVKGGQIYIRPLKIIVTSQYKIEQVFVDPNDREAIARRFNEIEVFDWRQRIPDTPPNSPLM